MRSRMLCAPLLFVVVLSAAGAALPGTERVERELTFEIDLPAGAALDAENLLGSIRVLPARPADPLRVVARVVAESKTRAEANALAESIDLEHRIDGDGAVFVRAAFPVDTYTSFRLPRSERDGVVAKWIAPFLRKETVAASYGGRSVEVGDAKGAVAVAVHLEIVLPVDHDANLRQLAGGIDCNGLRGNLDLNIVRGSAVAEQIYGTLRARTGGGELRAGKLRGDRLELQSGSGGIDIDEVRVDELRISSGSGAIHGIGVAASSLFVDSREGDIRFDDLEPETFEVVSGDGNVEIASTLVRTRQGSIETGGGNVTLRIGRLAPFELRASTSGGKIVALDDSLSRYDEDDASVLFRRRQGGADLTVTTVKGDVRLRRHDTF